MQDAALAIAKNKALIEAEYPEISLGQLERLTDRTGIIQHSIYSIPNRRTGYCTDDNARALSVAVRHYENTRSRKALNLVSTYLSFVHYAQIPTGKFHNFMSFDQIFLDGEGSEDCQGRTMWALGQCLAADIHDNVKEVARDLFRQALWVPETLQPIRAKTYSMLGLALACKDPGEDRAFEALKTCAEQVARQYEATAVPAWRWYEPFLTYSNALMPRALFLAYEATGEEKYLQVARESWDFLCEHCFIDGMLQIIGCNGWFFMGQDRAWFDQQPVDAMMMVLCALDAFRITGEERFLEEARLSFEWFIGRNALNISLHDPVTGGCFDGLMPTGRNHNQGAESTISCLFSQIEIAGYVKNGNKLFVDTGRESD